MNREFTVRDISDWKEPIEHMAELWKDYQVFCVEGDLGAGKTTFLKMFLKSQGLSEPITSPTYSLIQEYGDVEKIFHIDLYRINDEEELLELGIEDLLLHDSAHFYIEWPDIVYPWIESDFVKISITLVSEDHRKVVICPHESYDLW